MKKYKIIIISVLFFGGLLILIYVSNRMIADVVDVKNVSTGRIVAPVNVSKPKDEPKNVKARLTRRTNVIRGEDYLEHILYAGDVEIARFKEGTEGVFDLVGELPTGKVYFEDTYKKTYGEEYYRGGQRNGVRRTFYQEGGLKSEEVFSFGRLVAVKEFYTNGHVRFEVKYDDGILFGDQREVGLGKLYNMDGSLKYEWDLTRNKDYGFKKSYNQDGTLRQVDYYNEWGEVMANPSRKQIKAAEEPLDWGDWDDVF